MSTLEQRPLFVLCQCGCGEPLPPLTKHGLPRRYRHGHSGHRNRPVRLVDLRCEGCGRAFQRYPSQVGRFCSRACAVAAPHAPRKYEHLRRDFFADIDTPEKASILGFLVADGSVSRTGRRFDVAILATDRALLDAMQAAIGGGRIRAKRSSGYGGHRMLAVLEVCSVRMVQDLARWGVVPNKTHITTYPLLRPEFDRHFVRGLYDGDGWIGRRQFVLVGSAGLTLQVQAIVAQHTGCLLRRSLKRGCWYLTGSRRDRAVLSWLYLGVDLALTRKEQAWRTYWT